MNPADTPETEEFVRFLQELWRRSYLIGLSKTHNSDLATEIAEDTQMIAIRKGEGNLDAEGKPIADRVAFYVTACYKIVPKVLAKEKRRREQVSCDFLQDIPHREMSEEESMIHRERKAAIEVAMQESSEDDQLLYKLHCVDGLTHAEAGTVIGISSAAASMRYSRLIARLREKLGRELIDPQPRRV